MFRPKIIQIAATHQSEDQNDRLYVLLEDKSVWYCTVDLHQSD